MPTFDDPTQLRALATELFNHTWTLIDLAERTPEQVDEMIHASHASRYLWGQVGDVANWAVGEWQCARVYSTLGRGEPALWHARRCLELTVGAGFGDWRLASAHEGLARAARVAGDETLAVEQIALAQAAMATIADEEDRAVIEADLASLPAAPA